MTALRKTPIALTPKAAPFAIRAERASDVVAREALLDACFGENRHTRTCQRLRDGRAPAEGLALSAVARGQAGRDRAVVARQRRGRAGAGARPAGGRQRLPQARGRGRADGPRARGGEGAWPSRGDPARRRALLRPLRLLGRRRPASCRCPAPFERERLLGLELREGALDGAWGMIVPTGGSLPKPKAARTRERAARPSRCHASRHRARWPDRASQHITTIL